GPRKNQIKYFFLATVVGFSCGTTCFLPVFGIDVYPILNFTVPLYPIIMTYAIARYRLMDISIVIHKGLAYSLLLSLIVIPACFAILVSNRATLFSIPPLIAASLILACGLWIVLKNPKATTNITFGSICLAVCFWLFGMFMMLSAGREQEIIFWGKFAHAAVVFIPAVFYHFCVSFLHRDTQKGAVVISYLLSAAFLVLVPTDLFTNGLYSYFWGSYPKAGPLHPLFLVYFASVSGVALKKLYVGYKSTEETSPLEAT